MCDINNRNNWSLEEVQYLIENFAITDNKILQNSLNRSITSIRCKANKLKLIKSYEWTNPEIEYLIKNFSTCYTGELCKHLNKSKKAIQVKASRLGLSKDIEFKETRLSNVKRNKTVGRDLNYDVLCEIAKLYKTRGEFILRDSSAYTTARNHGYLDKICSHMISASFSIPQLLLYNIIKQLLNVDVIYNDRKTIKPFELDVYVKKYNIAFEYNGKYWHRDIERENNKLSICHANGIRLIVITERNRNYFEDIIEQIIENLDDINISCNLSLNDIKNLDKNSLFDIIISK